jgi:transcription antitermination factor NusG
MSDQKKWYSWVIKRNRFENVVEYIRANVPEVDKFFYPQIKKEYQTKRGVRVKDRPLYEGYIFLRYSNHDVVFHKLSNYPFITTFAGCVTEGEIERMQEERSSGCKKFRGNY